MITVKKTFSTKENIEKRLRYVRFPKNRTEIRGNSSYDDESKHGGGSAMVSASGVEDLVNIDGNMNVEMYHHILINTIWKVSDWYYLERLSG